MSLGVGEGFVILPLIVLIGGGCLMNRRTSVDVTGRLFIAAALMVLYNSVLPKRSVRLGAV